MQLKSDYKKKEKEYNKRKAELGVESIDTFNFNEIDFEAIKNNYREYKELEKLRNDVKNSFRFPKANEMDENTKRSAINSYTLAKARADSHFWITKLFASIMPGIFKGTAKDVADEKAWRLTLRNADFTAAELGLNEAELNSDLPEKPAETEEVNNSQHGEIVTDVNISEKVREDSEESFDYGRESEKSNDEREYSYESDRTSEI